MGFLLLNLDFLDPSSLLEKPCVHLYQFAKFGTTESADGFSLPLSPGRFFPDFIAELVNGRLAIIEYKGKHLAEVSDELHKKEVGELWAERSNGECVFVWVVDQDWATLDAALKPQS